MVGFDILLLLFLSYLPRYHLVVGVLVNITWDDSGPDPMTGATWTYMPSDQWNFGPTCSECTAKLDFSRVQNKTWHDATYQNTLQHVQIDFTGSAFYLYGVTSEFNDTISSIANYSYFIDGDLVGTFTRTPSGQPAFHYNFLLYANSSIPNGTHQFSMQNGQDGDTQPSLVLLDYAIYSTNADRRAPSSSSTSPSASSAPSSSGPFASQYFRTHVQNIVIAGVISFAVFMMALVAIAYYRHRRHRFNSRGQYDPIDTTAHPTMAHWEDLPQTPSSAGGFYSRPNKHISTPYRGARISDSEAMDSLLRPTTSLSTGSSRSKRLDSSTSGTFGDHRNGLLELQPRVLPRSGGL